ncbi:MAG: chorismate mutase [Clostridia bacterium]|nr:chorismate mutase [Clostridia bacterium]
MNKLEEARSIINEADSKIAELFCERMQAVRDIAQYKLEHGLPILDQGREEAVIARNSELIKDDTLKQYYMTFIKNTMAVSRAYQHMLCEGAQIAYCGVEGAFANIAAKRIFPDGKHIPYRSFSSAYRAVCDDECDCAVLPIENSYAGEVGQVMDLMFSGELYVNGVYDLHITHNLIGACGAKLSDIKTVISHPQALEQCEPYIRRHGFTVIQATNTAVAAQTAAQKNDSSLAAIASAETASLYGLEIIDHDINESNTNTTRFAVFSRTQAEHQRERQNNFLLMFTVNNKAGALAKAISVIGEHKFNMKVLRSRPMKDLAWQYYFYIEAEGDEQSEEGKKMLKNLSKYCDKLKVVGSFSAETVLKETK